MYNSENSHDNNFIELDSCVLDAVLAASFDWKELANRLTYSGRPVPQTGSGMIRIAHAVYRMTHRACVVDCKFASGIINELNRIHKSSIEFVEKMRPNEICTYLDAVDIRDRFAAGGFLWALATDSRPCMRRLAGVFVRRILTELYSEAFFGEKDEFDQIVKGIAS